MGAEVNLLAALPKGKRNLSARSAKTDEHVRISREYGEQYFDGPREYGYGGYRYDGRWIPVARDMEGRVLTELVDPDFARENPVTFIGSYESLAVEKPLPPFPVDDLPPLADERP